MPCDFHGTLTKAYICYKASTTFTASLVSISQPLKEESVADSNNNNSEPFSDMSGPPNADCRSASLSFISSIVLISYARTLSVMPMTRHDTQAFKIHREQAQGRFECAGIGENWKNGLWRGLPALSMKTKYRGGWWIGSSSVLMEECCGQQTTLPSRYTAECFEDDVFQPWHSCHVSIARNAKCSSVNQTFGTPQ